MKHRIVAPALVLAVLAACSSDPEAGVDAAPGADSALEVGPDVEPRPDSDAAPEPEPDAAPEPEPDAAPDAEADAVPDAAPDAEAGPDAEPDAEADADAEPDAEPDAEAETTLDAADASPDAGPEPPDPDLNGDGVVNVLIVGTSKSVRDGEPAFDAAPIAAELESILGGAPDALDANVVAEDLYATASVPTGYGQGGDVYEWTYYRHSLAQYYYWPEGQAERLAMLAGQGELAWDYVVIAADPYVVSTMPGYYALGANKVASKAAEGGAQPLLLMVWGDDPDAVGHIAEVTHRVAAGAAASVTAVPAALAWPGPGGGSDAYLAAAAVYAQIFGASASASSYTQDDALADAALAAVEAAAASAEGPFAYVSPFAACGVSDRVLNYNHTGTSSENGILKGLQWVLGKAQTSLVKDGEPPIDFNYGRANTEFEPNKRYQVDPESFDFSLGFPMQDHSNHGDDSMRYGLDKRRYDTENGTDLGVARYMLENGELPWARAVPIRALFAQLREAIPDQSAYSDGWHMNKDLDKASGAYMYTLLTGNCALDAEPADPESAQWRTWYAHKTGYETAWTLMHLQGRAPGFKLTPEAPASTTVSPSEGASLSVAFMNPPASEVTVTLSTDSDLASAEPSALTFTPDDHDTPQAITLTVTGARDGGAVTLTATTTSADPAFDGLTIRHTYLYAP